jgi:hypothetical protein
MRKVLNAGVGLWQCGKSIVSTAFPQLLFLFFWREFLEKFTLEGEERSASASYPPVDALLKVLSSINLTMHRE